MKKKIQQLSRRQPGNSVPIFWNLIEEGDSAELQLYGEFVEQRPFDWWIGKASEGDYVISGEIRDALEKIKNKANITVRINSPGGCLYTGLAIYNALKSFKGRKKAIVEGICMSAATMPMCACDEVIVMPGSITMIHGVSMMMCDYVTLQDIEKISRAMECMEATVSKIYNEKTGIPGEELREKMKDEWWLTPEEAVESGFADTFQKEAASETLKLVASASGYPSLYFGNKEVAKYFRSQIPSRFGVSTSRKNKPQNTMDTQTIEEVTTTLDDVQEELDNATESLDEMTTEEIEQVIEDVKEELDSVEETISSSDTGDSEEETALNKALNKAKSSLRTLRSSFRSKARAARAKGDNPDNAGEDDEEEESSGDEDGSGELEKLEKDAEQAKAKGDKVAHALACERLRLAKIDSFAKASGLDAETVNRAKYGDTRMTAEKLAYKTSMNDDSKRRQWLSRRREETRATAKVKTSPGGSPPSPENKTQERGKLAASFKEIFNKFRPASHTAQNKK